MSDNFSNRREQWAPQPRPEWVTRINAQGDRIDLINTVPLDENSLLNAAKANTGLDDFGEDDWFEPFQILVKAYDEEAELNLTGRLMTRSEMLIYLEARLKIEDTYKRHPEINEEEISKPLFIIGQGRTGTSALQNLLAHDPDSGIASTWEAFFPCPPPETTSYESDVRIEKANHVLSFMREVIPEIDSMHEFTARLPTECIHMHCLSFQSPAWFNSFGGQVDSYNAYMQTKSTLPAYQYEKRVLKLLQWKNPRKHWVLKSPYSILHLPEIQQVYPDVSFVWTHRDPVKALSSVVNLVGTLFWSRSDKPFMGDSLEMVTNADIGAMMLNQPIDWLESGEISKERLCNIKYDDFVSQPMQVVKTIYQHFGMAMNDVSEQGMQNYIDANPRSDRPKHQYSVGQEEQISQERKVFERYQSYFDVGSEV